jgi:hypothetical protein
MGKSFARTQHWQLDESQIVRQSAGIEQIVWFTADRGPHLNAVRIPAGASGVTLIRTTFGPRAVGDLLRLAIERATENGAVLHLCRLLYLSDPTDIATIDAVASDVDVAQRVGGASDEYVFYINELGVGGDNFSVVIADGTVANTFKITLTCSETGIDDEVYDSLSVDTDDARYFETILNTNNSGRLRGTDTTPTATPTLPDELPANGTYPLTGGSNGTALNDASIIGDASAGTGLHGAAIALQTAEVRAAHQNLSSTPAVVAAGLSFGEIDGGADLMVYQEPPDQADPADSVDFRNGDTPYSHAAFDSSFGQLIYARQTVFDVQQGINVLLPTVGELAPLIAKSMDFNQGGAPWLPTAGGKRGGVSAEVLGLSDDVGVPTRLAEAENLSKANINVFRSKSGRLLLWGNQTLIGDQESLLLNAHVQHLLIWLRRITDPLFDRAQFEIQNPDTWKVLFNNVDPVLDAYKGIAYQDYRYKGDQDAYRIDDPDQLEVNTVADLAAGIYYVDIPIQPYSAIDQLVGIRWRITSTAQSFSQFVGEE